MEAGDARRWDQYTVWREADTEGPMNMAHHLGRAAESLTQGNIRGDSQWLLWSKTLALALEDGVYNHSDC